MEIRSIIQLTGNRRVVGVRQIEGDNSSIVEIARAEIEESTFCVDRDVVHMAQSIGRQSLHEGDDSVVHI